MMVLINTTRRSAAQGRSPADILGALQSAGLADPEADPKSLEPALEDDALLFYDWEEEEEGGLAEAGSGGGGEAAAPASRQSEVERVRSELEALRLEHAALKAQFGAVQQAFMSGMEGASTKGTEPAAPSAPVSTPSAASARQAASRGVDEAYFDSYSFFDIHREMLSDAPRTEAYRRALEENPSLVRGATVLDVGCGTGVLSLFAARGGARRVVGVDAAAGMAEAAREVVKANGYEHVVSIVGGKLEALDALPLDGSPAQADVLVSEWMGYGLFFESMLDSVLVARDRFLKPGGAVLPDRVEIFAAAACQDALDDGFWRSVYGLDMTPLASRAGRDRAAARVCCVKPELLVSRPALLRSWDLCSMAPEDQDATCACVLEGTGEAECRAIALWFDALFTERFCREAPVRLPTGPADPRTHWVQVLLPLPAGLPCGPGERLACRVSFARDADRARRLNFSVQAAALRGGEAAEEALQGPGVVSAHYHMGVQAQE